MSFFDIENIFFTVAGYQMSYLEFFGTIAGAIAVWLSAKANIWSWSIGVINVVLFFFLFYQVQLYPDMFLQVFFLITNLLGWWRWANPMPGEENQKNELFFIGRKQSAAGTAGEKGTGLGLILSFEFVKLNNGNMEVESMTGKGTTFRVILKSG